MTLKHAFLSALLIAVAVPAPAAPPAPAAAPAPAKPAGFDDAAQEAKLMEAVRAMQQGRHSDAVAAAEQVIAAFESYYADPAVAYYSASEPAETIVLAGRFPPDKKQVTVLGPNWAAAWFVKGFALIDLGRPAEARPALERAVALAPLNAHYISELAEWHKTAKDWPTAYRLFEEAWAAAGFASADSRNREKGRAWRGMGFVLIEQGRLDEAQALFRKCLQLDPNDAGAKNELQYIEAQRARVRKTS